MERDRLASFPGIVQSRCETDLVRVLVLLINSWVKALPLMDRE